MPIGRLSETLARAKATLTRSAIENSGEGGADDMPPEVDVQRHGRVRMSELVGDLAGREPRFGQPRRDRLAHGRASRRSRRAPAPRLG
jgi:hypothetical protein